MSTKPIKAAQSEAVEQEFKAQQPAVEPKSVIPAVQNESEYTVEELSGNARQLFDVHPDIASAALYMAKVKRCTISKAKAIIKEFMGRKLVN